MYSNGGLFLLVFFFGCCCLFVHPLTTHGCVCWPGGFLAEWFLRLQDWITLPGISNGWHEESTPFPTESRLIHSLGLGCTRGPLHLHIVHARSRQQQMAACPGCVVAGLNPHVNSECVPCSQWLSSAATGLQPVGGRKERSGRDRPASARRLLVSALAFQTFPKCQNPHYMS